MEQPRVRNAHGNPESKAKVHLFWDANSRGLTTPEKIERAPARHGQIDKTEQIYLASGRTEAKLPGVQ